MQTQKILTSLTSLMYEKENTSSHYQPRILTGQSILTFCFTINYFCYSDEQVLHPPDPQRYLSDSEVELKQSQESIARESEIRWAWGKLPQVSNQIERNMLCFKLGE